MKQTYLIISRLFSRAFSLFCILLISSLLLNFKGPSYLQNFFSKNPTKSEILKIQKKLNYTRSNFTYCLKKVFATLTLNPGYSDFHKAKIIKLFKKALLTTTILTIPSFFLGFILALFLAVLSCHGSYFVKKGAAAMITSSNSLGYISLTLLTQILFCTDTGLNLFPVYGWDVHSFSSYLKYGSTPTFILVFSLACFYAPLFQSALQKEKNSSYVRTLLAQGCPKPRIIFIYQLKNAFIPILSHTLNKAPSYIFGGHILIENYFNIPGLGFLSYESCIAGDDGTLLMIIAFSAFSYLVAQDLSSFLCKKIDPRTKEAIK